ncbi:MAG: peptide chain release factor N(5)-glutamine methyltransferase [Phycisphaerales bacterium]|jgi:release factor glutamine methyltransferase|nr:peptide chain release factor N(5)-glutamine methyltransferase [Phycisphaerales bacterium]
MTAISGPWTVRRLLEWTSGFFSRKEVDSPRLSAELLLSHVLGVPRIKLYTDYDRTLKEEDLTAYRELVRRAGEHEPIAHLTGRAYFFNLELEAHRGVLIPRPDTETLVENVLQTVRHQSGMESPRILDLCTGSGCIAAALAKGLASATVIATDLSPKAIAAARANLSRLGLAGRVSVVEGDLFEALDGIVDAGPFHLIVSNPPYIPTGQISMLDRNVREYEPKEALDGGPDGLDFHRRILTQAAGRMLPGGMYFLEIGFDQGPAALALGESFNEYDNVRVLRDYGGNNRVLTGRRK